MKDQERCPAQAGCGIARCLFYFVGIIVGTIALLLFPPLSEHARRRRLDIMTALAGTENQ